MSRTGADGPYTGFDSDDCHLLMASQHVGRLVIGDTTPNVRPVNFVAHARRIFIRTDHPLPADARVAFEVDQIDPSHRQGWSVVAIGHAQPLSIEFVPDDVVGRLEPWAGGDKPCWSVITVESISGVYVRAQDTPEGLDHRGYL